MTPKEEFISIFKENITRPGSDKLLHWLEESDFFTAPASTRFHGNHEGGLVEHSLQVYKCLLGELDTVDLKTRYTNETVAIVGLLHDICKANFYFPEIKNFKDEATNTWKKYQTYKCEDHFPLGHGEKSVIMLQNFIKLTASEIIAIRWHMGMFDPGMMLSPYEKPAYQKAVDECPLTVLLQISDFYASHMMEYMVDQKVENIVY